VLASMAINVGVFVLAATFLMVRCLPPWAPYITPMPCCASLLPGMPLFAVWLPTALSAGSSGCNAWRPMVEGKVQPPLLPLHESLFCLPFLTTTPCSPAALVANNQGPSSKPIISQEAIEELDLNRTQNPPEKLPDSVVKVWCGCCDQCNCVCTQSSSWQRPALSLNIAVLGLLACSALLPRRPQLGLFSLTRIT
jgi:hypothetical protein